MGTYESAFTRPPAPPPLDLVQAFLNSVDLEDGTEEFATVGSLENWIGRHLPGVETRVTDADRLRAITVRETLRDVVEGTSSGTSISTLTDALDGIPFMLHIRDDGMPKFVTTREGVDALLARVMTSVHYAMIDGNWERLKICRNDVCRWAFYDASKNHSGVWCSMATCGSQAKTRAYRTRAKRKGVM